MDWMTGSTWATNLIIDRLRLPEEAHEYVKDSLLLRQPVEEHKRLETENAGSPPLAPMPPQRPHGLSLDEVLTLLAEVQEALSETPANERVQAEEVLAGLRDAVRQEQPDTGEVVRRTGMLRSAVERLDSGAASAATIRAATALTDMAINGAFA